MEIAPGHLEGVERDLVVEQIDKPARRLTLGERMKRWLGTRIGKSARRHADKGKGKPKMESERYAISKGQRSAAKGAAIGGVISAGTLAAVVGVIRGFWPDLLWPREQDGEVLEQIAAAVGSIIAAATALGYLWGLITNIWKNFGKLKKGVQVTTAENSSVVFDFAPKNGGH